MKKILQDFKNRLFGKKQWRKIFVCDPSKNMTCKKDGCWDICKGPCRCTYNKKYAKTDSEGKPQIATDIEAMNLDWLEQQVFSHEGESD